MSLLLGFPQLRCSTIRAKVRIPAAGTVVKQANEVASDEWQLGEFNFDLEGMEILE